MYVGDDFLEEIFRYHNAKSTAICSNFCIIKRLSRADNDDMVGLYLVGNGVECVAELP